jgi:hypothetical protein
MERKDARPCKEFEELAHRIQASLAPNGKVTLNDSIPGAISKSARQVDISIRAQIGQFSLLIAVECKDWKDPVDGPAVEAFIQKLQDIKAQKGAMVAARGFTEGALNIARAADIATYRLVDTDSVNWKVLLRIPYLLIGYHLRYRITVIPDHSVVSVSASFFERMREVVALDMERNVLGKIHYMVAKKWNADVIPKEIGTHHIPLPECHYLEYRDERLKCEVIILADVTQTRYFGGLGIEETQGFYDVQNKSLMTQQFTTAKLCPGDIETGKVPGWKLLAPDEQPHIDPVFTEVYSDALPESEEDEKLE